jgi:hypothetical protein
MHAAQQLWERHHPISGYPAGVEAVPEPIPGLAFFPGGYGLWGSERGQALPSFPVGGVMVLGHDFHSRAGYDTSRKLGGEPKTMPTWRNLLALLCDAGIAPERCFFTNLYMGLRSGAGATGPFPGATSAEFVAHCRGFLLEQLRAQRPALILTLGIHVPPVIAPMSPQLAPWTKGKGIKHLDAVGAIREGVTFRDILGYSATVVALIHPSLRHASLRHRRYGTIVGPQAELAMLRAGIASVGGTAAALRP